MIYIHGIPPKLVYIVLQVFVDAIKRSTQISSFMISGTLSIYIRVTYKPHTNSINMPVIMANFKLLVIFFFVFFFYLIIR